MEEQLSQLNDTLAEFQDAVQRLGISFDESSKTVAELLQETSSEDANCRVSTYPTNKSKERTSVPVYTRVVFRKIGQIDTVSEKFTACLLLECRWHEPLLDELSKEELISIDPKTYWNPKITIDNLQGKPSQRRVCHEVYKNPQGRVFITEKVVISGKFNESMELQCFPLDTQQLSVHITSERMSNDVMLVADPSVASSINIETFADVQEWNLHDLVEVEEHTQGSETDEDETRPPQSRLQVACYASRRPGYFLYNIVLVMIFICSLAFATFVIHIEQAGSRLKLSFTLVLTMVTFKFASSRGLPRISYLTYLDHYVFTSMSLLSSICIWHAIVHVVEKRGAESAAILADKVALGVMAVAYLIVQLVFAIRLNKQLQRRSGRIKRSQKEQGFKEQLDEFFDPVVDSLAERELHAESPI